MKTTFSRVFFPVTILLMSAMMLFGICLQLMVKSFLTDQTMSDLKHDATAIAQLTAVYASEGTATNQDFLLNLSVASQVSEADAVICDATGRLILCSDAPLGCPHQGLMLSPEYRDAVFATGFQMTTGTVAGLYSEVRHVVAVPVSDPATSQPLGLVIVSRPQDESFVVLKRVSDLFLILSLCIVPLTVLFLIFSVRRTSNPLRDMARTASAFGHGDLKARTRVREDSPQEIRELALAFNNMATSLEQSEYQRQEFVANVSHELKTPMTTISGYIDGMLDGTIPEEKHRQYMHLVSQETKRLSRLVRSMLEISRLQDREGIPEDSKSRFDVLECAGKTLITFEQPILQKNLDVQVQFPEHPVYTRAHQDHITQVIYNLLDNAVKFCPEGQTIGLSVAERGEKVVVSVTNQGATIPEEELPLLFDRFHKLDKSRSENRDGWGLGLYIVKTIICSHGEDISVSSRDGQTQFTFTLPRVN